MNEIELLEFGIYNDVLGKGDDCIPGIMPNGLIDIGYFEDIVNNRKPDTVSEIKSWFENYLTSWDKGFEESPLILCSGGVDSSALVATMSRNDAHLIHTSYVDHDNNDLNKLCRLLDRFPLQAEISSISGKEYLNGLLSLAQSGIPQNTYGPSVSYALSSRKYDRKHKYLITGSAPDEFFYGMEKYSFEFFSQMADIPIDIALEKLDTNYNMSAFSSILNSNGFDLLEQIKNKRKKLYKNISLITESIYDAQRLLAYSTVTSQHIKMYDDISNKYGLKHVAPFMNEDLIKLSFGTPIMKLVDLSIGRDNVEIGKKHLKDFLGRYMSEKHIFSRKIGFHAPVTKYLYSSLYRKYFDEMPDSVPLKGLIDPDRFRCFLSDRLSSTNQKEMYSDYFLYAILNIFLYSKENENK